MPRLSQDSWAVLFCFPPFKKHPSSSTQSPVTQAGWQWSKLPKGCLGFFLPVYLFTWTTTGMCWRALDPINTANGARKGRQKRGGRGAWCLFPCRFSSRAGKAETLENTLSLDFCELTGLSPLFVHFEDCWNIFSGQYEVWQCCGRWQLSVVLSVWTAP